MRIREIQVGDIETVTAIYNHYIDTTVISFEEEPVSADEMQGRIDFIRASGLPWLVAEAEGSVFGYAYAGPWRTRSAYKFSVESTVYLSPQAIGMGLGYKLYQALFERLRQTDVHVVIGGIALPNPASVALHEKMGMRKVAHFEDVGFKFGQWIDVGYWQIMLGENN